MDSTTKHEPGEYVEHHEEKKESDEPCDHPSCDATYGHADEEDSACPWHSGNCWYCGYGDCRKTHPKCDGSTYQERNTFD